MKKEGTPNQFRQRVANYGNTHQFGVHVGDLMNQGGLDRGTGIDQATEKSLPQTMNQGASTKRPGNHPMGTGDNPRSLKSRMNQ
jgi:hypothetical protein